MPQNTGSAQPSNVNTPPPGGKGGGITGAINSTLGAVKPTMGVAQQVAQPQPMPQWIQNQPAQFQPGQQQYDPVTMAPLPPQGGMAPPSNAAPGGKGGMPQQGGGMFGGQMPPQQGGGMFGGQMPPQQGQQLADGRFANQIPQDNSQQAYNQFMQQAQFAPGGAPTYEQWSARRQQNQPQVQPFGMGGTQGGPTLQQLGQMPPQQLPFGMNQQQFGEFQQKQQEFERQNNAAAQANPAFAQMQQLQQQIGNSQPTPQQMQQADQLRNQINSDPAAVAARNAQQQYMQTLPGYNQQIQQQMANLTPLQQQNAMQYGDAYYGEPQRMATPAEMARSGLSQTPQQALGQPMPMPPPGMLPQNPGQMPKAPMQQRIAQPNQRQDAQRALQQFRPGMGRR
jgi:hypothetical protein